MTGSVNRSASVATVEWPPSISIDEVEGGKAWDAEALIRRGSPLILRGVAARWNLVVAGLRPPCEFLSLLCDHASDARARVFVAPRNTAGRFAYDKSMRAFNFESNVKPIREFLDELRQHSSSVHQYAGSLPLETYFPGLADLALFPLAGRPDAILQCIWIGNGSKIPAHFDSMHNLATVVSGQRRFILLPPEQVENLYVGPFDFSPAGQPMSVVDFSSPDLVRFPRFAHAMSVARIAVLEPGDALYIPPVWWHQVDSIDPVGAMVNFWWDAAPNWSEAPKNALMHALLAFNSLGDAERRAWRTLFHHYVFDRPAGAFDHIPREARGAVEALDRNNARHLRLALLSALNR